MRSVVQHPSSNAVKRAGISGVTFHCLRKTGTDFLLRSGISLETTQKLGGWKTPEVMLKHYRNPSPQEMDEAVTCIDSLVRVAGAYLVTYPVPRFHPRTSDSA